ncbi:HPr family phosphocarrier protein [Pleionea sp. CnH1-48]|uniref:HPr family phosphocarrier protein n=1 Tax=Pleionea sp. CnH1-48 TaxID=2954494 RepID=UPI0020970985|nr:HPr family phosphocarrier protein [Pleionea sp. CnH1-48]MCO7224038.1 HPr family phosphocarrier protein [Pleionea sp. CnH1-48]
MIKKLCTIVNQKGLHARAAAEVVNLVEQYDAQITLHLDGNEAQADNLIHLLTLAAYQGKQVEIRADGTDAQAAINALASLIENRFNEVS